MKVLPSHPSCDPAPSSMNKTWFKLSFPAALRLIEMVPGLRKLKVLILLNLFPFLSYGASFDQFMTIKSFSKKIYTSCVLYIRIHTSYVNFEKHICSLS